jgi:hypothetical protein
MLGWAGGGITLIAVLLGHLVWQQRFEGKI